MGVENEGFPLTKPMAVTMSWTNAFCNILIDIKLVFIFCTLKITFAENDCLSFSSATRNCCQVDSVWSR